VRAEENNLSVSLPVFKSTSSDGIDHIKYLMYQKKTYDAPQNGQELVYETVMASKQFIPDNIPFPYGLSGVNNAQDDIRLSSGGLNCSDLDTFLVLDFLHSNETIYAFYERLPLVGLIGEDLSECTRPLVTQFLSPAKKPGSYTKLAIAYNYKKNYVRWIVNEVEVFRVNKLGYPIDRKYSILDHRGVPELVRPKAMTFGFGIFTLMDMYNS
jgi:hypothetical protein